jgi:hypothetical protein
LNLIVPHPWTNGHETATFSDISASRKPDTGFIDHNRRKTAMNTSTDITKPVLVLGAAGGKTGRRVAQRLEALGVPVRNGSRSGDPRFDWEDPSTWRQAVQGVASVYLVYYPDLAVKGADAAVSRFLDDAVNAGVRRVVLLSGRGEEGAQRGEEVVRNSGIEWTILRASWFAQNFSEGHLLDPVLDGRSRCRRATSPSRSSMRTISPTSRSRRSLNTRMSAVSTN